jgi:diacylglycerol kinase (ATP)
MIAAIEGSVASTLLIANPAAGAGRGRRVGERLAAYLAARGNAPRAEWTAAPRHAEKLAEDWARNGGGPIIAVGGDGTVHEVVNGLLRAGSRGPLLIVPAGGGNDAARCFRASNDPEAVASLLETGALRPVDVGELDGAFFFNGAGFGFDGETAALAARLKPLSGFPAYLSAALLTLLRYEKPRIELSVDGKQFDGRMLLCAIGNGPACGGGFFLTPEASPDNGVLDFCVIGDLGRIETLRQLPRALRGTHRGHPRAHFFRGKQFEINISPPRAGHIDGEMVAAASSHRGRVLPGALDVLVPRNP